MFRVIVFSSFIIRLHSSGLVTVQYGGAGGILTRQLTLGRDPSGNSKKTDWLRRAGTNQEKEEGARGSRAARQENCQHTARARGLSRCAERDRDLRSAARVGETGSNSGGLLLPRCLPRRELRVRVEMSGEQKGCEGHCLPQSNAHVELHEHGAEHRSDVAPSPCPQSRSKSAGKSEAKATFVRSMVGLTRYCVERSFGFRVVILCRALFASAAISHHDQSPAITNPGRGCSGGEKKKC